jgi:alkanesulfonate monooxygenase SsuD/methylene tetrahydromethanopterin reductase-like flavin-dependent oxidoreductase (luciferase family)
MQCALFTGMALTAPDSTPLSVMRITKDAVRVAEETGFDIAWFAEHHFSEFSICASPLMMAMHCAGFTSRIKLGPGVLVLPLHDPLRMVQEVGLLDVASEGRAVIGIGNGHQPHEFRSLGLDIEARQDVFMESWDVLEMAWRDGRVAYDGQHLHIPETFLSIGPLRGRRPELLVAAHDPRMMARAVRSGAVVFISPGARSAEQALALRQQVVDAAPGEAVRLGVQRYVFVTESHAMARRVAESMVVFMRKMRLLRETYPPRDGLRLHDVAFPGEPDVEWLLAHAPIGDEALVTERLARDVVLLQPEILSVYMAYAHVPGPALLASLQRFGAGVLPALRDYSATARSSEMAIA